jgi:hypothetical protein
MLCENFRLKCLSNGGVAECFDFDDGATFLCGAGVSLRAGLPLFDKLTQQIYAQLGETPSIEPAEHRYFKKGIRSPRYDRSKSVHIVRGRFLAFELLSDPA